MRLKYHKIMISANVISTGYAVIESIKIHIENCWKIVKPLLIYHIFV